MVLKRATDLINNKSEIKDVRVDAALAVKAVIQDQRSLTDVLPQVLDGVNQDAALLHELTAGTLRWWERLSMQIEVLLSKPLQPKDFDIYCLMLIGLYQIQFTRIPDHAAVSQTVNGTKSLAKPWSTNLVNAVLRRSIREKEQLQQQFQDNPVFRYSHPQWMIKKLQHDWPENWEKILESNNKRKTLTLRVNVNKSKVDEVLGKLDTEKVSACKTKDSPVGIKMRDKSKIWQSDFWKNGHISVQDESAQLAAYMVELKPGMRGLDACAAPGGKTCHFLELQPSLDLLALEKDAIRMKRLQQNLDRLNLQCDTHVADASDLGSWWDGELFDLVLLDAPCSGSGVIHKHPDIKHLRRATDVEQNVQTQRKLLDTLWSVLKTGGSLLYCTCSVFRQENDQQAQWFINKHPQAQPISLDDRFGLVLTIGRQRLPSDYDSDGFYYAGFTKKAP